jgi:hypothetical protein
MKVAGTQAYYYTAKITVVISFKYRPQANVRLWTKVSVSDKHSSLLHNVVTYSKTCFIKLSLVVY